MGCGNATNLDTSKQPNLVMARHGVWLGTAFGSETERDKGSIVGGAALRSASRGCRVQWDRGQRVPQRELEVAKRELRPLLNALRFIESSNRVNCPDGDAGSSIGPLQISEEYHRDAWGHRAGRWTACRELAHAEDTVVRYWLRYCPGAIRAHDWELLAKFHNGARRAPSTQPPSSYRALVVQYPKPPRSCVLLFSDLVFPRLIVPVVRNRSSLTPSACAGGPRGTKHSKTRAYWRKVVRHLAAQQPLGLSGDVPHIPPQLPGTFRAEGLAAECSASSAGSGAGTGLTASAVAHYKQQQSLHLETGCSSNEISEQMSGSNVVDESEPRAPVAAGGRLKHRRGHRRPQQALRAVPWRSPASAVPAPPSPSLESAAHGAALAALSALPFLDTMALDGDADVAHSADVLCGPTQCTSPLASPARATRSATAPPAATPSGVAGCSQTPTTQPQCAGAKVGACGDTGGAAGEGCVAEARAGAGWLLWDSELAWSVEQHEDFFTPAASLDVQESVREYRGATVAADVADKLASLDIGKLVHGMKRGAGREAVAASSDDLGERAAGERSAKLARAARDGTEGSGDSAHALAHARSAVGASSSALADSTAAIAVCHSSSSECGVRGRASREVNRDAPREAPSQASRRVEEWLTLVDGGRARTSKELMEGKNGAIMRPTGGPVKGSREGEPKPSPTALPHAQSLHSTPVPWAGAVRAAQAAQGALGAQGTRAARPAWAARHGAWQVAAGPSAADKVEAWVHAHGARAGTGGAAAVSPALTC
ncbi:unnamed protein product [Closterium sp. Yama58-4]|nr:unnamed protein product [Closterium sp. Yama58-4]